MDLTSHTRGSRNTPSRFILPKLIEGNGYEARKTSKEQRCQDLCWKDHNRARCFVFRSYTMHELRKQNVSLGKFRSAE